MNKIMMLKIEKEKYINTDYIVSLLIGNIESKEFGKDVYQIVARLIDNSQVSLFNGGLEEMENKLREIVKEINIHNTKIM